MKCIYSETRSLGALRAPTFSWRPFGPLDLVLRALWALRQFDPRRFVHDVCILGECFSDEYIHDAYVRDSCIHDAYTHDIFTHDACMHDAHICIYV